MSEKEFFSFYEAINHLKIGDSIARKDWVEKGIYLKLELSMLSEDCTHTEDALLLVTDLDFNKWRPNPSDIFASDWVII